LAWEGRGWRWGCTIWEIVFRERELDIIKAFLLPSIQDLELGIYIFLKWEVRSGDILQGGWWKTKIPLARLELDKTAS
jgi:hypothetical protein